MSVLLEFHVISCSEVHRKLVNRQFLVEISLNIYFLNSFLNDYEGNLKVSSGYLKVKM